MTGKSLVKLYIGRTVLGYGRAEFV